MSEPQDEKREKFYNQIDKKASRKHRARQTEGRSLWAGLGAMGVVGWTVAIPTLLGVLLGLWLDANWPGPFSWTLTLLIGGLILGCLAAWRWVSEEMDKIQAARQEEQENE
jgi:ATP synthase protein I